MGAHRARGGVKNIARREEDPDVGAQLLVPLAWAGAPSVGHGPRAPAPGPRPGTRFFEKLTIPHWSRCAGVDRCRKNLESLHFNNGFGARAMKNQWFYHTYI